jgi:hypothetical protein
MNDEDKNTLNCLAEKVMLQMMSTDFWAKTTYCNPSMINEVIRTSYMVAGAMLAATKEMEQ